MTDICALIVNGRMQTLNDLTHLVQIEGDMNVVGAASLAKDASQIVVERSPSAIHWMVETKYERMVCEMTRDGRRMEG